MSKIVLTSLILGLWSGHAMSEVLPYGLQQGLILGLNETDCRKTITEMVKSLNGDTAVEFVRTNVDAMGVTQENLKGDKSSGFIEFQADSWNKEAPAYCKYEVSYRMLRM